jgi:nucleotide-binding universal stress UspA family protein
MYRKILLAYDGSTEGRRALREGAALALRCNAEVFLLAVIDNAVAVGTDGAYAQVIGQEKEAYQAVLDEGVQRLRALGFSPDSRLGWGRPGEVIVAVAREIGADLVVAGHRHKGVLAQWWSDSIGIYLVKHIGCSVLIGQTEFNDEQFAKITEAYRKAPADQA